MITPDLRGPAALQRGRLVHERQRARGGGGPQPQDGAAPVAGRDPVADQLGRQPREGVGGARAERGRQASRPAVTGAHQREPVGRQRRGHEGAQRQCETRRAGGQGVALGGGQRHPDDTDGDRHHSEHLAHAHGRCVMARTDDEQDDETRRQGGLHDGLGREQQRA
jgi:hypothetical protein